MAKHSARWNCRAVMASRFASSMNQSKPTPHCPERVKRTPTWNDPRMTELCLREMKQDASGQYRCPQKGFAHD